MVLQMDNMRQLLQIILLLVAGIDRDVRCQESGSGEDETTAALTYTYGTEITTFSTDPTKYNATALNTTANMSDSSGDDFTTTGYTSEHPTTEYPSTVPTTSQYPTSANNTTANMSDSSGDDFPKTTFFSSENPTTDVETSEFTSEIHTTTAPYTTANMSDSSADDFTTTGFTSEHPITAEATSVELTTQATSSAETTTAFPTTQTTSTAPDTTENWSDSSAEDFTTTGFTSEYPTAEYPSTVPVTSQYPTADYPTTASFSSEHPTTDAETTTTLEIDIPAVCPASCPANSDCKNADEGCQCDQGYKNDTSGGCSDINECDTKCSETGKKCTNHPGFFTCTCEPGYYQDGDDCEKQPSSCPLCGENQSCKDPDDGCICNPGWAKMESPNCEDVDECLTECSDPTLQCTNTEGSYYCTCIPGYQLDSISDSCVPVRCNENKVQCDSAPDGLCADSETVISFPATLAGYTNRSMKICASDTENDGIAYGTRSCSLQGSWETPVFLSSCGTGIQQLTHEPIESEEQREHVSSNLEVLTSSPETLDDDDIASTTEVLDNVTNVAKLNASIATSVVSTISNVVESPSLASSGQAAPLLLKLDEIASKVVLKDDEPYVAVSNNISMIVAEGNDTTTGVGIAVLVRPDTSSLGFRNDQFKATNVSASAGQVLDANKIEASIFVPVSALKNSSRIAIYVFGNKNLFPRTNDSATSSPRHETLSRSSVLNSLILSATVGNASVSGLPEGERLSFSTPISNDDIQGKPLCVFWKENASDWFTDGCEVDEPKTTNTSIACLCDHLTNFATLLDLTGDTAAIYTLDTITIVGCSISSFALLLVIGVFAFFPNTRKGTKFRASFLLLNLSVALLGLNVTLLVSEMPFITDPVNYLTMQPSCMAIAAILHLFMLCACAWMNCEAAILFLAVLKPLYVRSQLRDGNVALLSSLWGWLMPIVFVSLVLAIDKDVYLYPYTEGESKVTCWIATDMIVYLAVIPVTIMIGANVIIYVLITYKLCRNTSASLGRIWKSTRNSQRKKVGVNFCVMTTLGVTWIFGFFLSASSNETAVLVFAYIFTILNSLQGCILFLLYVLRNKEVRRNIAKEFYTLSDSLAFSTKRSQRSDSRTFSTDLVRNPYRAERAATNDDIPAPYSVRIRASSKAMEHDNFSRTWNFTNSGAERNSNL